MKKLFKATLIAVAFLPVAVSQKVFAATTNLGAHLNYTPVGHANPHAYVCMMPEPVNPVLFIVGAAVLFLVARSKKLLAV